MWVGAASAHVIWGHKDHVHAVWRWQCLWVSLGPQVSSLGGCPPGGALTGRREAEYLSGKLTGHPYGPGQKWLVP